jgi:hypothetical protein
MVSPPGWRYSTSVRLQGGCGNRYCRLQTHKKRNCKATSAFLFGGSRTSSTCQLSPRLFISPACSPAAADLVPKLLMTQHIPLTNLFAG